jgi:hypothetical protein
MENKDYPGKILHGNYSHALKAHVKENISRLTAFEKTLTPVIPYLSAWQEQENAMWYEFAGQRFSDLMGCPIPDLADVFRNRIVERRVYDYQDDNHHQIQPRRLRQPELTGSRKGLRKQGEKKGRVEAIYKVQLADGSGHGHRIQTGPDSCLIRMSHPCDQGDGGGRGVEKSPADAQGKSPGPEPGQKNSGRKRGPAVRCHQTGGSRQKRSGKSQQGQK